MAAVAGTTTTVDRVTPMAFDRFWPMASDLELSMPLLIRDIKQARLRTDATGRQELWVRTHLGARARFDVAIEDGWCWWPEPVVVVRAGGGTHPGRHPVRVPGGARTRSLRWLSPMLEPITRRMSQGAVRRLETALDDR